MTESFHAAPEPDKKQQKKHFKRPSLRSVLITAGIAAGVLLLIFLLILWYLVASAPDIDSVTVFPEESATYICDQEGNPLRKLTLSSSNRDIVSLDQIPEILQEAVIAIEDERFYSHGGIDLKGISRALWRGITRLSFSEGASTITQQLINLLLGSFLEEDSGAVPGSPAGKPHVQGGNPGKLSEHHQSGSRMLRRAGSFSAVFRKGCKGAYPYGGFCAGSDSPESHCLQSDYKP